MKHVFHHFAQASARPLSLETTGGPRSANSAAPKGCVGQGYGAACPMSTVVQHVPVENSTAASATAQGIVTRMGQDPKGLGGAAIEPGPAGMRPASAACSCARGAFDCAAAAPSARKRSAAEGAAAAIHAPPSNTGVNKTRSGHGG